MRVLEACNGGLFLVILAESTKPVQRLEDPSDRPIGDPGMVHLPYDTQKCTICQTSVKSDTILQVVSLFSLRSNNSTMRTSQ